MPDKIEHEVTQDFEVSDEVISADLDVWAKWLASAGTGLVEFIVYIQKPDLTNVELYNNQYTDGASGEANILSDLDVKAHLTQQGTHTLRLLCGVRSNDNFICSEGWYDNISLDIKIKKVKVILEQLAAVEDPQRKSSAAKSESLALSESLSEQKIKSLLESLSFSEVADRLTKKSIGDVLSLVEHYLETGYVLPEQVFLAESYFVKLYQESQEALSIIEALLGKKTVGNVVTIFNIIELTKWDGISPVATEWDGVSPVATEWDGRSKVTTKWDKKKVIIN